MANVLRTDILFSGRQLYNKLKFIEIVVRSAAILNPRYKSRKFWKYLCSQNAYYTSTESKIGILYKLSYVIFKRAGKLENSSVKCGAGLKLCPAATATKRSQLASTVVNEKYVSHNDKESMI